MLTKLYGYIKAHWILLVVCLLCVGGVHLLTRYLYPRVVTKTVETIKYVDRVQTQTVTVEKPVTKWKTRTVTVYVPGTLTPKETVVTQEGSTTGGSTTKTNSETDLKVASQSKTATVQNPEGRWNVRVLAGVSLLGSSVVGAGAEYRLIGPMVVGAEMTIPLAVPKGTQVLLSVGLRL